MPGKGKLVQRDYDAAERAAIGHLIALLGPTTYDVFLNNKVYWSNVPSAVWEYTLGGCQVIKKWLGYREKGTKEKPVFGSSITKDEARYVTEMVQRIAALLIMDPALDANYEAVKRDPTLGGRAPGESRLLRLKGTVPGARCRYPRKISGAVGAGRQRPPRRHRRQPRIPEGGYPFRPRRGHPPRSWW